VAAGHGVSPQQVALAWELAKAPVVIPIPGARRPESILDSAAAVSLRLSADDLARLDRY
jgi:aryl-alcohol dehydrogenase-like predicted oxidoreductase